MFAFTSGINVNHNFNIINKITENTINKMNIFFDIAKAERWFKSTPDLIRSDRKYKVQKRIGYIFLPSLLL